MVKIVNGYAEKVLPEYTLSSMFGGFEIKPKDSKNYLTVEDFALTEEALDTLYIESAKAGYNGDSFGLNMTNGVNQTVIELGDEDIEGMTLEEIGDELFELAMEEYLLLMAVDREDA